MRAVSGLDGGVGSVDAFTGADPTALSEGKYEERAAADAAGYDAAHLLPGEVVPPERSDGPRDAA